MLSTARAHIPHAPTDPTREFRAIIKSASYVLA